MEYIYIYIQMDDKFAFHILQDINKPSTQGKQAYTDLQAYKENKLIWKSRRLLYRR